MHNNHSPPKRGFTDRMYLVNLRFVICTVAASFLLIFLKGFLPDIDVSGLPTIIASLCGELGLHTGLIVWKAKVENFRKYPQAVQAVDSQSPVEDISMGTNTGGIQNGI